MFTGIRFETHLKKAATMTRVDFYILADSDEHNRNTLICKLAEKAFRHDKAVFIHADDDELLAQLDEHLWHFRADSFVPHRLVPKGEITSQIDGDPVQLSAQEPTADHSVLINLAPEVPTFFSRFERALEVVNQSAGIRDSARERYRFYQQRGYPLQTHKM